MAKPGARSLFQRRTPNDIPLRYDDGFRGGIAMLLSIPLLTIAFVELARGRETADLQIVLAAFCASFTVFFLVFLVWTHRLFSRTDPDTALKIAAAQYRGGASWFSRLLGLKSAEEWGMSAAFLALFVSVLASIMGAREQGLWLPIIVLITVATSWATVVYAFGLRYFRLHAAGETITFDIDEPPTFTDFLSMAVMVSSVGAMSAGTPRTRAGLTTVRTHTFISFGFNALAVAMAVSFITGFITAGS